MNSFLEQAQQFTRMWADVTGKMMGATLSADAAVPPPQAARDARGAMFQALSQHADQFMRSPQFLELAKQSIDGSIALRKQWNDFFTGVRHGTEGLARRDVDGMILSLRHLETRMLDRIEELGGRLSELDARLERIESRVAAVEGRRANRQRSPRPTGRAKAGGRQDARGEAAGTRGKRGSPAVKAAKSLRLANAATAATTGTSREGSKG